MSRGSPVTTASGEAGLAVVTAVLAAAEAADGQAPVDEAVTRRLAHRGLEGSELWVAGDDGFALRHGEELDLVVAPSARGTGVGTLLAAAALEGAGPVTAWSHGDHPAAARLAQRFGLDAPRALWVMRRDLAGAALPPLAVPDGVRIRGYDADPGSGDAEAVLRINAAAFAHHPEQGEMDAADLAERMAEAWFDPAGLLLAEDAATGEVLGFHWTKRHSPTLGEVYVVGIGPAAQGRGLGKALTLAGLHHLADGGSTQVLLYVESDNAPARAVYAGLGFSHADSDTHVQYQRA